MIDKSLENSEILMSASDVKHVYGMGERLFTECGDPMMSYETSVITYMNGLNGSVAGTNTANISFGVAKNTAKKYEYDDFGKTDDIRSGFGYNGEELDDTGLIYLRARYYSSELGRFIQIDSFKGDTENVESQNRYIYTNNNPYKYIDKSGNNSIVPPIGFGGGGTIGIGISNPIGWVITGATAIYGIYVGMTGNDPVGDFIQSQVDSYNAGAKKAAALRKDIISSNSSVSYVDVATTSSWAIHAADGGVKWKTVPGGKAPERPWANVRKTAQQLAKELCDSIQDIYKNVKSQEKEAISKSVAIPTNPPRDKVIDFPTSEKLFNDINRLSKGLVLSIGFADVVSEVIEKIMTRKYTGRNTHSHHIVPKGKYLSRKEVRKSQIILENVGINVKYGLENRVDVPYAIHKPLHSRTYTLAVYDHLKPIENHPT